MVRGPRPDLQIAFRHYSLTSHLGRTDTCAAIFLGAKPRFEHIVSDEEDPAEWSPQNATANRYKTKLFNLTGSYFLSQETVSIYWGLRNLSAFKEKTSYDHVTKPDTLPYNNILIGFERRLISILRAKELIHPTRELSIYPLFANAAILHIYIFLRDLSKGLPFVHLISPRIRTILESIDVSRLKVQYPEMLLWIFMMGGLCGADASERSWFAAMVAGFCLELGVYGGN